MENNKDNSENGNKKSMEANAEPDPSNLCKSRRSQDKERSLPRRIIRQEVDEEASTLMATKSPPWPPPGSLQSVGAPGTSQVQVSLQSFDRLTPRSGEVSSRKRTVEETLESSEDSSSKKSKKCSFKKEYSKLKTMVPALGEREDLTKVEIIEETIRYIDALHHQLATRVQAARARVVPPSVSSQPAASLPSPLRPIASAASIASPTQTSPSSSTPATSSTNWSSPQEMKAAVENIQAMFAAYLEEHQNDQE